MDSPSIYNINNTIRMKSTLPGVIRRVGGKSRVKDKIIKYIQKHKIYVEPFIGGGSVFFGKVPSEFEIINDKDKGISDIYKDFQKVPKEIVEKYYFKRNKKVFDKFLKTNYKDPKDRLFRNLYLSASSFNGNRERFQEGPANTGKKWKSGRYQERLKGVTVLNQDFKKVIKKYDSPDSFFYLDPPYSYAGKGHYQIVGVTMEDLLSVLKSIKGKFLMSYDDSPTIRKLFKGYKIRTLMVPYVMMKGGFATPQEKKELLISNY